MRHRFAVAAGAIGALALSMAWAETNFQDRAPTGAHYRSGFSEPTCSTSGLTVSCTGTQIGGVGNNDATLVLSVSYSATVQCRNNGGKIVNVKTQVKTTSSSDDLTELRNGTLIVSPISSTSPTNDSFTNAAVCPNGNWDKVLMGGTAAITSFSYTITFQGYTLPAVSVSG